MNIEKLKYPIGQFQQPSSFTPEQVETWIDSIATFPARLKAIVNDLSPKKIAQQYRPQSWTVKQIVHHCADSHLMAYLRFKITGTEHEPAIMSYDENKFARLIDSNSDDLTPSLLVLEGLHIRWSAYLQSLDSEDFKKSYYHPEFDKRFSLREALPLYAWHCEHHLAQVKQALDLNGNFE